MAQEMGFLLSHARISSKRHKGIKGDDIFNLFQPVSYTHLTLPTILRV